MTCKYLKSKAYRMPQEVGGSMHPEFVSMPDCELGRLNNVGAIVGEVAGCESIESNGLVGGGCRKKAINQIQHFWETKSERVKYAWLRHFKAILSSDFISNK